MVFKPSPSKASIGQNRFAVGLPDDDREWSLPMLQYLTADLAAQFRSKAAPLASATQAGIEPDPVAVVDLDAVVRTIFDHYAPGLYESCDAMQVQEIWQAWQEASQVSMGESSASSEN